MLRRLEKRILVDLPNKEARRKMVQHHLPSLILTEGVDAKDGGGGHEGCIEMTTEIDYEHIAEVYMFNFCSCFLFWKSYKKYTSIFFKNRF